jgi:hypothetical protein
MPAIVQRAERVRKSVAGLGDGVADEMASGGFSFPIGELSLTGCPVIYK